jgi:chromosome segregation ATPase
VQTAGKSPADRMTQDRIIAQEAEIELRAADAARFKLFQARNDEIERLQTALQLAQRWAGQAADALQPSAEENMRLRADNAEWQDRCLRYQTALQDAMVALCSLEATTETIAARNRIRHALSNNVRTKPDSA